jgi:hypothetical protein
MKRDMVVRFSKWFRSVLFLVVVGACLGFAPLSTSAAPDSDSCATNPESRQFDFWMGEWTISYPGGPGGSVSKVTLSLDKCMVVESWDSGKGHRGENMFAYSSEDKSWHGMFADNMGRVHVFEGKVASGTAEFYGPSRGPNGESVLNRIRIVRLSADKVEQTWEKSRDNGATWTTEFRGGYTRKKS